MLLQHKSFDSEHDKLRDKHLSSLKWETLVSVKEASRRKSEDSKHSPVGAKSYGFYKFRSSVDASSSLYSIKVFFKSYEYSDRILTLSYDWDTKSKSIKRKFCMK